MAQLVEHHLAKVRVAGSNPVVRSRVCEVRGQARPGLPGGVAEWFRQGPAKPCTRVRFPPPPRQQGTKPEQTRAISSVGERYLDTVEATGSIPVSPTRRPSLLAALWAASPGAAMPARGPSPRSPHGSTVGVAMGPRLAGLVDPAFWGSPSFGRLRGVGSGRLPLVGRLRRGSRCLPGAWTPGPLDPWTPMILRWGWPWGPQEGTRPSRHRLCQPPRPPPLGAASPRAAISAQGRGMEPPGSRGGDDRRMTERGARPSAFLARPCAGFGCSGGLVRRPPEASSRR